jgi:hypothetical protein
MWYLVVLNYGWKLNAVYNIKLYTAFVLLTFNYFAAAIFLWCFLCFLPCFLWCFMLFLATGAAASIVGAAAVVVAAGV